MLEWFCIAVVCYAVWLFFLRPQVREFKEELKKATTGADKTRDYHSQRNRLIDEINERREEFFQAAKRLGLGNALIFERWSVVGNAHSDALRAAAEKKFDCAHDFLCEAHRQAHALVTEVLGRIAEPAAEAVSC
jgi:hypothetical protein